MNYAPKQRNKAPRRNLPYKTEEELNEQVNVVKIQVAGTYIKKGERQGEVFESDYEIQIIVPQKFDLGHVKLQANRYLKLPQNKMAGVNVRTWAVDATFPPEPHKDKNPKTNQPYTVRDFYSEMGIADNERTKVAYHEAEKKRVAALQMANGEPSYDSFDVVDREVNDHGYSIG